MSEPLVIVRSGQHLCALPLVHVDETMRPLPIVAIPGVPRFVRGVSVVRGDPTPVVDLRIILGDEYEHDARRLVTLKLDVRRRVGLLVDEVLGVHTRPTASEAGLPPLLQSAREQLVDDIAVRDHALITVLRASRLIPEGMHEHVLETGPAR